MYHVELKKNIRHIMSLFYCLGLWHRDDDVSIIRKTIKLFPPIYYSFFTVSLLNGAITTDDKDESIFLALIAIISVTLLVKLYFITWRQKEIFEMLNGCGVFTVEDDEDFNIVEKTLKKIETFYNILFAGTSIFGFSISLWPFLGISQKPFLNVAPNLDLKNNRIAFWVVNAFLGTEVCFACISSVFSAVVGLLLIACALRYEVLGNEIIRIGVIKTEGKMTQSSKKKRSNIFLRELIAKIDSHRQIRKYYTEDLIQNQQFDIFSLDK